MFATFNNNFFNSITLIVFFEAINIVISCQKKKKLWACQYDNYIFFQL